MGSSLAKSKLQSFFWAISLASEFYVPTFRQIKYRRQGITEKKKCNIQNKVKVWSKEKQIQFSTSQNKR